MIDKYMNPLHLLWIVPCSAIAGLILGALFVLLAWDFKE